jgi:hypothetical protein
MGDLMSEKFQIDLNPTVLEMLKRNISICPWVIKHQWSFIEAISNQYIGDYRDLYFHRIPKNPMFILKNLLYSKRFYSNELYYYLFKGFVYGEYRFVRDFIPQQSHEERLTGHLISELCNVATIIGEKFKTKSKKIYGREVPLNFYYADLSTNRMEKITGADFALMVHLDLPDCSEVNKVMICQVKKIENSMEIDEPQLKVLNSWAGDAGYYCCYDMKQNDLFAPLLISAKNVEKYLTIKKTKSISRNDLLKEDQLTIPLSIALTFELLDCHNTSGKIFANLNEARNFILRGDESRSTRIEKIFYISIGGVSNRHDIIDIPSFFHERKG